MLRIKHFLLLICCMGSTYFAMAQATVTGTITDDEGLPVIGASVFIPNTENGVLTDTAGHYSINIPSDKKTYIKVTYVLCEPDGFSVKPSNGENLVRNLTIIKLNNVLQDVTIKDTRSREQAGSVDISIGQADINPSPIGGVEGIIKTMVGSKNELTSQYTVRGGNYDENLVYVNDFEIYRPFLVRSGQQEGLSFVNPDLTQSVSFSVGGFQSKYGDKMSSVLDVTYKHPEHFGGSVLLSFLGANVSLEGASRNKKLTYLVGARQKSNQYLLQSQPTKGQYNPSFTDLQAMITYKFNDQWDMELIGNYARNRFNFTPEESESAFGYVNKALQLTTIFQGNEMDQFDSRFAGWSLSYRPTKKTKLKLLASNFETNEFETFDIEGEYGFYELESDLGKESFGQKKYSLGTGKIHDFARNYLTANVSTIALRGSQSADKHFFQFGMDATYVKVDDKLMEWQMRDSAGFSQPFDTSEIRMNYSYHAKNNLDYTRLSAFLQDNILLSDIMTLTLGVRTNYTYLNKELIISPRVQYSVKPKWEKDYVFRISTGIYDQPPFYREMRDMEGNLNTNLKAQKSFHIATGFDHNFMMWGDRPFKITAEAFYKQLWDLVPYEYDNVRIRYYANNNAKGYAYGGEIRMYGQLVKDAESWISVGYLKTDNKILDPATGEYSVFFPRPTDQRLNFGMFFSDYLPRNKNFKMYLNMIYSTGLPFSPPGQGLNPDAQLRIPDYKRVDIGFSALLIDGNKQKRPAYSFFSVFKSVWLSAEVFNLLGIQNTISYQWIQDYSSGNTFAVPNRLTSRLINLKLAAKF